VLLPKLNLLLAFAYMLALVKKVTLELGMPLEGISAAMLRLTLPNIALPKFNLSGLKLALGLPPLALNLDLSPLSAAIGSIPAGLSGITALASLVVTMGTIGFNLPAFAPCTGGCPMA
jgi:hypothetical protein